MEAFVRNIERCLSTHINDLSYEHCEGCQEGFGNQLGHSCLTLSWEEKVFMYFQEAFERLDKNVLERDLSHVVQFKMLAGESSEEVATMLVGPQFTEKTEVQCSDVSSSAAAP